MASKKTVSKKKAVKPAVGRRGVLSEQLVFRVTKATRGRLNAFMRERDLAGVGDALRVVLREAGL